MDYKKAHEILSSAQAPSQGRRRTGQQTGQAAFQKTQADGGYLEGVGRGLWSAIFDVAPMRAAQGLRWLSGGVGVEDTGVLDRFITEQQEDMRRQSEAMAGQEGTFSPLDVQ